MSSRPPRDTARSRPGVRGDEAQACGREVAFDYDTWRIGYAPHDTQCSFRRPFSCNYVREPGARTPATTRASATAGVTYSLLYR